MTSPNFNHQRRKVLNRFEKVITYALSKYKGNLFYNRKLDTVDYPKLYAIGIVMGLDGLLEVVPSINTWVKYKEVILHYFRGFSDDELDS